MTGEIVISVTDWELSAAKQGDEQLHQFLCSVSNHDFGIELFLRTHSMTYAKAACKTAKKYGIEIKTIHGTPLRYADNPDGTSEINGHVREALYHYADPDKSDDLVQVPHLDVPCMTVHPPKYYSPSSVDLNRAREQLVTNLDQSISYRDETYPVDCTVALENVCPRPNSRSLLTAPSDANALQKQARKTDGDPVNFTFDFGHANNPESMLEAMGTPVCVHTHGTAPQNSEILELVKDRYGVCPNKLDCEPVLNEYQHLPPWVGNHDDKLLKELLNQFGYQGPIVVELQQPFKTRTVIEELGSRNSVDNWGDH